eukprot:COSAG02_NODE_2056_length_9981_cov_99.588194_6_plen_311_part_00
MRDPGPVNQSFKQFYRISRTEPLPISAVAPDAHQILATPRPPAPTGAEIFDRVRNPLQQERATEAAVTQARQEAVLSNVARDYFAVIAPSSETTSSAAPTELLQARARKPVSPIKIGPRAAPQKQWEPGPVLSKYGISAEEAMHPRDAFRVDVAHLDAEATLVIGGISSEALQAPPAAGNSASRASTPQFTIKQRNLGVDMDLEASALATSVEALRPMAPPKPQAPRAGGSLSHSARLPNRGRWNANAQHNMGPGSHAARRLAATKRGRTLHVNSGVRSGAWAGPPTTPHVVSPRLPPLKAYKNAVTHTS